MRREGLLAETLDSSGSEGAANRAEQIPRSAEWQNRRATEPRPGLRLQRHQVLLEHAIKPRRGTKPHERKARRKSQNNSHWAPCKPSQASGEDAVSLAHAPSVYLSHGMLAPETERRPTRLLRRQAPESWERATFIAPPLALHAMSANGKADCVCSMAGPCRRASIRRAKSKPNSAVLL